MKRRRPSEGDERSESLKESAPYDGIRDARASELYIRAKEGVQ